jgi:hypothetical protein
MVLAPQRSVAQDPARRRRSARRAEWLALVDKQDGEASWKAAGARLQDSVTLPVWTETVRREREPRGALLQRAVTATTFHRLGPGFAPGRLVCGRDFPDVVRHPADSGEEVILEVGPATRGA